MRCLFSALAHFALAHPRTHFVQIKYTYHVCVCLVQWPVCLISRIVCFSVKRKAQNCLYSIHRSIDKFTSDTKVYIDLYSFFVFEAFEADKERKGVDSKGRMCSNKLYSHHLFCKHTHTRAHGIKVVISWILQWSKFWFICLFALVLCQYHGSEGETTAPKK